MPVINRIADFEQDMTAWRHDLHAHPELALQEVRTSALVQAMLREFGVDEVVTGLARTGVGGVIRGRAPGGAIGLRADMDALPMTEETGLPYASTIPGKMHACGHDGHTAMLLGAAKYLAETRNFAGTVYVIFQPAEENLNGGKVMIDDGLFERFAMSQVFGMHNKPDGALGTFYWRDGPMMAAVANIEIDITGKGAHGAHPDRGIDPIVVASTIVTALQSIVSRRLDPTEAGVVTIGQITAGQAYNIIPQTVHMKGTARWFEDSVGDKLEHGVRTIATNIAASFDASAEVMFDRVIPPTVNDARANVAARRAMASVSGEARVQHLDRLTLGAEDFAFMLQAKQGAYCMLGSARGPSDHMPHHPKYDFNDEALSIGASYWATLAEQLLPPT